jgi:hypothetical protein
MSFIKLEYKEYVAINNLFEDVENLSPEEQMVLVKVKSIIQLMDKKRDLEDAGSLPLRSSHPALRARGKKEARVPIRRSA